ncbi:MAG: hypothetical protein MK212_12155 [Saprospiraceae bacterium]|nr:hypothetical protein [Saprospiraceae bacterium]
MINLILGIGAFTFLSFGTPMNNTAEEVAQKTCDCASEAGLAESYQAYLQNKTAENGQATQLALNEMVRCLGGKQGMEELKGGRTGAALKQFEADTKKALQKRCSDVAALIYPE